MSITTAAKNSTSQFDNATDTSYLGKSDRGTYVFTGAAKIEWAVGEVPNGGYVMAIITDSVLRLFADRYQCDPVALNCFFFNKTIASDLIVEIEELKMSKKGYCIVRAVLKQTKDLKSLTDLNSYDPSEWIDKVQAVFTMGNMDNEEGVNYLHKNPVPAELEKLKPYRYTYMGDFVDSKFDLRSMPATKEEMGIPEYTQIMSFKDQRPTDFKCVPYWCDMIIPPPTLLGENFLNGPTWCPTMQLEVQFKRKPTGKKVVAHFITNHIINGRFDIDGQVWDENGNILAITRHQCLVVSWSRNTPKKRETSKI